MTFGFWFLKFSFFVSFPTLFSVTFPQQGRILPSWSNLTPREYNKYIYWTLCGRHCFEHFTRIDLIKPYSTLWGRYYYVSFHFTYGDTEAVRGSSSTGQAHVTSKRRSLDLSARSLCTHHRLPEKCWFLTRSRTFVPLVGDVRFSRKPLSQLT